MSRASYNSLAEKHRVDAVAARNLALAQTLSESVGRQKDKAARDQQLNIAPPPAQYQSSVEASTDYAHANQKAIQTLESFMHPRDAASAFGDLLKHDQIAEFNQYAGAFKNALGTREQISYIEFVNFWQVFIDRLQSELDKKVLYLSPEEKVEFTLNEQLNRDEPTTNPLPITRKEKQSFGDYRTGIESRFKTLVDLEAIDTLKGLKEHAQELNHALIRDKISLKSYKADDKAELRKAIIDAQERVAAQMSRTARQGAQ